MARPLARRRLTATVNRRELDRLLRKARISPPDGLPAGGLEKLYKAAIELLRLSFDDAGFGSLSKALTAGTVNRALDWGKFGNALASGMVDILKEPAAAGIDRAFLDFFGKGSDQALKAMLEGKDDNAIAWASQHAGKFIVDISEELRAEIRGLVATTVEGQRDARAAAAIIRNSIGLTARQSAWVAQRYKTAVDQDVKKGTPLETAMSNAELATQLFSSRLLDSRALAISRTEIQTAQHEGRALGYQQLFDSKFLDQSTATKYWTPDPKGACPICEANADQGSIGYDEDFSSGDAYPPAHPNCECDWAMNAEFSPLTPAPEDAWAFDSVSTAGAAADDAGVVKTVKPFEWQHVPREYGVAGADAAELKLTQGELSEASDFMASGQFEVGGRAAFQDAEGNVLESADGAPELLSDEERSAVDDYAGFGYLDYNTPLRLGDEAEGADVLNGAIEKVTTTSDMAVFRGVGTDQATGDDFLEQLADAKAGSVLQDPGFASTSLSFGSSAKFAGANGAMLEITVPAGEHALPIVGGEGEVLLQSGRQFVVTSVDHVATPDNPSCLLVRVTLLPR